jgi:ankyrin repeat protein
MTSARRSLCMSLVRRTFCRCVFIFCLLLLSSVVAYSQEFPHTYLFVEVKDTKGTAVADATINVNRDDSFQHIERERVELIKDLRTGKDGVAYGLLYYGPYTPTEINLQISKPGYLPFEDIFSLKVIQLFFGTESKPSNDVWNYDGHGWRLKIALLKTPETPSQRRTIEAEQKRRQLLLAAKKGDTIKVAELLRAGADANAKDGLGAPAIAWAAFMGYTDTIGALLDGGANVRAKDNPGHDALTIYLDTGLVQCSLRVDRSQYKEGLNPCDEIIRRLIKAGAAVNPRNPSLAQTLRKALDGPNYSAPDDISIETLKALMRAGASTDGSKEDGYTPLMFAAQYCRPEVVKALLDEGVPVDARDKQGATALILAVRSSRYWPDAIKVLLKAGADINASDNDGRTALMEASKVKGGSYEAQMVEFLLKAGAKVNLADKNGQTALTFAKESGNTATVKLLEEAEGHH